MSEQKRYWLLAVRYGHIHAGEYNEVSDKSPVEWLIENQKEDHNCMVRWAMEITQEERMRLKKNHI